MDTTYPRPSTELGSRGLPPKAGAGLWFGGVGEGVWCLCTPVDLGFTGVLWWYMVEKDTKVVKVGIT